MFCVAPAQFSIFISFSHSTSFFELLLVVLTEVATDGLYKSGQLAIVKIGNDKKSCRDVVVFDETKLPRLYYRIVSCYFLIATKGGFYKLISWDFGVIFEQVAVQNEGA